MVVIQYSENNIDKNTWVRYWANRVMKHNKNNLICIVGPTGSGKTYAAISCCEMLSKRTGTTFTIKNVVFTLNELMQLVNSGIENGACIIFDEPQVSISSREFMSEANRVFNYLLSTFRHRNFSLFFATPFEDLLDIATRKLFHSKIEMVKINYGKKTASVRAKQLTYNSYKRKFYEKFIKVLIRKNNGTKITKKLKKWDIHIPSLELVEDYEKKKMEFTTNLNRRIQERLERYDARMNPKAVAKEIQLSINPQMIIGNAIKKGMPPPQIIIRSDITTKQEKLLQLINSGITDRSELARLTGQARPNVCVMLDRLRGKGLPITV